MEKTMNHDELTAYLASAGVLPVPLSTGKTARVTTAGETVWIDDASADTHWWIDLRRKRRCHKGDGTGCFWSDWETCRADETGA